MTTLFTSTLLEVATVFLTADGRPVFRIGTGSTGLASDGEMVYGLPVVVVVVDTAFQSWLRDSTKTRIVLVEVDCYISGSVAPKYLSNGDFVSEPSDTPPNISYSDAIVISIPEFTSRMSEQFTGRSTPTWGDLEMQNINGILDAWLNYGWAGRTIRVYLGDPEWDKDDFELILVGTVGGIYAKSQKVMALKVRDKQWTLNVPVQTTLIGGTTANKNQPMPICYGSCKEIEPRLTNAATHEYQVNDVEVQDIPAVFVSGNAVAFTPDLANGKFVLTSEPSGRVTANVLGTKRGGVYLTKCADIMQDLILYHTLLTTSDINATSISDFNSTCPQPLGLYVRERENMIDVLDLCIRSVGGWYDFNRTGFLELGRLEAPIGTADIELTPDDFEEGKLESIRTIDPTATVQLGYARIWTVQTEGLADILTETRRAELANEYLVATASDLSIKVAHPLALEPELEGTLLTTEADAVDEANRRLALRGVPRNIYRGEGFALPFSVKIGKIANVIYPGSGFEAGAQAVVVGLVEQPTKGRVSPELWL